MIYEFENFGSENKYTDSCYRERLAVSILSMSSRVSAAKINTLFLVITSSVSITEFENFGSENKYAASCYRERKSVSYIFNQMNSRISAARINTLLLVIASSIQYIRSRFSPVKINMLLLVISSSVQYFINLIRRFLQTSHIITNKVHFIYLGFAASPASAAAWISSNVENKDNPSLHRAAFSSAILRMSSSVLSLKKRESC